MNQGIEDIRKRGSRILKDGVKMLPAASLMKAEGLIRSLDDLSKPIVTIVNSYTTQIPGHAHLDKLALAHEYAEHPGGHSWDYWDIHIRETLAFVRKAMKKP